MSPDVLDLFAAPYELLNSPNPDDGQNWDKLFGSVIYAKIAIHFYEVVQGKKKPLAKKTEPRNAVEVIAEQYDDPISIAKQIVESKK
jgi:hypothetical protein